MSLFGLLMAVINTLLGFMFRTIVIRFVLFFGLLFLVHDFVEEMVTWIPFTFDIPSLFQQLPASMWYFFDLFKLDQGMQFIFNACITRFIIRRIPIIG